MNKMGKFKKVYMIYAINPERTEGWSKSFDDLDEAHREFWAIPSDWKCYFRPQEYELEEDSHHDCGDEE